MAKKKKQNNKLNRRDLLKMLGMTTAGTAASLVNPLEMLFGNIADGIINKAHAQAQGGTYRRYIHIQQPGGPQRWTFDLFLTPYDTAAFSQNFHVGTRYTETNGVYDGVEYATVNINGINVPWMWQFDVPKAGGGVRPMADLLQNLLHIRGINTGNPGHSGSQMLHFQPLGAMKSLGAVVADIGSSPLPALNASTSNYRFSSLAGVAPVNIGSTGNLLDRMMSPFKGVTNSTFNNQKAAVKASLDNAIAKLEAYAKSDHPGAVTVSNSLTSAQDMMAFAGVDLTTTWNTLYNKYNDLIIRALDMNTILPGINDKPIGITPANRNDEYRFPNQGPIQEADLRMIIQSTSRVRYLAESMAMIEYVIKNDLSDFISAKVQNTTNVLINGANRQHGYDEHQMGRMPSLLLNTMHNRAIAACMIELIDQLKAAGKFNDTVIDMAGEFGRSPRNNGQGCDHGYQAKSTALYCGAVNGPIVLGNVFKDTPRNGNLGTWGYASANPQLNNEVLNLGHMASTIATLLKQPSPITASPSLVVENNGVITPVVDLAKQT